MISAIYTEALVEFPEDIVVKVCRDWPRRQKFWPALNELIEPAERLMVERWNLAEASVLLTKSTPSYAWFAATSPIWSLTRKSRVQVGTVSSSTLHKLTSYSGAPPDLLDGESYIVI